MQETRVPDGATPYEDHDCGHLPCPPWLADHAPSPGAVAAAPQTEPELDAPHHVHDLWAVLGLGEQ